MHSEGSKTRSDEVPEFAKKLSLDKHKALRMRVSYCYGFDGAPVAFGGHPDRLPAFPTTWKVDCPAEAHGSDFKRT